MAKLSDLTKIRQLVLVGAVIQTGETASTVHPVTLNILCYTASPFVSVHKIVKVHTNFKKEKAIRKIKEP